MTDKLKTLADAEGGDLSAAGLAKKADGAEWSGQNATVTKEFVTKTAAEFGDAATAAKSIHTILEKAHEAFVRHKNDLNEAVEDAKKKNIYITADGTAIPAFCSANGAGDGEDQQATQAEIDGAAEAIGAILTAASETDQATADALRYHAQEKYNFRSEGFDGTYDNPQRVIMDANELIALSKRDPDDLSNEELRRYNDLLKRNEEDPVFAEYFALEMGPEGTLGFYADAATLDDWKPSDEDGQDSREARMDLLSLTEHHLGATLATASHSDSEAMQKWKDRVVELGPQDVGGGPRSGPHHTVLGFQAMSNLMRNGTYEKDFLNDYGDALVTYEKENIGKGESKTIGGGPRKDDLPYSNFGQLHYGDENDAGTDPMTGFMTALSKNPDASTEFFSSEEPHDNSAWVLKDRPEFNDFAPETPHYGEYVEDYEGPSAVYEAVGEALVAGATGMDPSGEMAQAPDHTDQHRKVLEKSLEHLAARKSDLEKNFPAEIRDDMAKVLVNHGVSVHATMSDNDNRPAPNAEPLLNSDHLLEVTTQVSLDQDAHTYLSEGLQYSIMQDFATEKNHPEDSLHRAGRTMGFLEEARHNAIGNRVGDELAEVGWDKNWKYHGLGVLITGIPGVGDAAQRGLDILETDWLESEQERINGKAVEDHKDTYRLRTKQLVLLADAWYAYNGDWAENQTGFSPHDGVYDEIGTAAYNGNDHADGVAGDQ
ncbi:DUF6571 family protein [Streptomyces sp. JJ66]|uniref:DUF6571 family protein n=1 Tax=Streptomyces sp. JJ66 TaxID=2803843 RepID=UPI00214BECCF|nr:DUF6571 family protein [Streptomyces sp. JJ66]